jgi:hypothetical protein
MAYAHTYDGAGFVADLVALFRHQLTACALQSGELCVAITDSAWMPAYDAACVGAAEALGADTMQATFGWNRAPDARALEAICASADLIVYMTAHTLHTAQRSLQRWVAAPACLDSSFKCNTSRPLGIGCCDGHTKQAPQQRGPWRDISRA